MNKNEKSMENNKKSDRIPKLRFPGFTGEWVERSFGELYEKHIVKNDLSFGTDKIISVAQMYYKNDAKVGNDDYLRTYNVFRLGDIAYEGNKSANHAYGRFVENTIGDGIVSHVFDVYSPISPDHCIGFWKYAINYERIMRPVLEKSTIKSTMMTNLIAKDFLKQKILVPPTLSEQQKIASCLSELDDLISAQDQKVEALKEKKKGLMQQLFPQPGETIPKLRFQGYTGDWEEIPLRKVATKVNRRNSQLEVTRVLTNSANAGVIDQSEYFDRDIVVKDNTDNYHIVELGDFVYNPRISATAPVGPISINKVGRGIMSPLYTVFKFHAGCVQFFEQYFQTTIWHPYLKSIANFGARFDRMNITSDGFFNMPLMLPTVPEQQKIAECLSAIDDNIAAEADKLEALKNHKKGLMQQLFPQPAK